VHVEPEGIFYTHVELKDVQEIVESHLRDGKPVERLFYRDPVTGQSVAHHSEIGFYSQQQRVLLRNCGNVNPEEIGDYLGHGGYEALKQVLSRMAPGQVIDEVKRSGLRGRGGAGFPTGLKWEFCAKTTSDKKYVVCNADEGDPGAFMDRSILEADPHSVIEGLTIAGYAMGAHHGYIYVRAEYPLAVRRLRIALEQAREQALLGNNILQSGFSFDIEVKEGAGAFVCGEETALMASIEGRRGMPRPRPPFPAQSGLWGAPTNINNVKSLASIPLIIRWGANWFSSIGTEKSKGTAVFALTGKVANNGLIEVPMGTTLRHIIYEIGGGIPGNKRFKAVQTGGPSGGCLPASMLDLPVDYERLAEAGSIMGSGGMIVADEDTCIVDLAKFFLSFTQAESCGKCVPCRVGTGQMLAILERITEGQGEPGDLDQLERLAQTVKDGSLCALGGTAPNPVLTTLRYFREEYEEHIYRKRCPALMCKALTTYYILPDKCQGCMICLRNCPSGAIKGDKRMVHVIDQSKCTKCGTCLEMCPPRFGAVVKVSGEQVNVPDEPVPVSQ
jgi:NADH:ubiquinone oxidoreductase subunit F (NADH-binding)/Pyruvate/2-oxoacid:ferredoxin oxidoreductase delta subunit